MKKIIAAILAVLQLALVSAQIEVIDADSVWNATTVGSATLDTTAETDEETRVYIDYADSIEYKDQVVIPGTFEGLLDAVTARIALTNPDSVMHIVPLPIPMAIDLVLRPFVRHSQSAKLQELEFDNQLCTVLADNRTPQITNITVTII